MHAESFPANISTLVLPCGEQYQVVLELCRVATHGSVVFFTLHPPAAGIKYW